MLLLVKYLSGFLWKILMMSDIRMILKLRDILVKLRNLAKHSNKVDKSTACLDYLTLTSTVVCYFNGC